ncbi:transcription initiation protein [Niabella ginsenosidivorans]|uniref:Transcription initiation protein n=1 Tax=Niabella ginsenosidivorans TaxID=1176587 RepID=A0A1A9I6T4_9BACT|nr:YciI family protein [Niabella ginsenosidivorans]ANH82759.1 transcription initiation protein [Niabella ginsenosidivorans]
MKEFLFIYRRDVNNIPKGSPEEMQNETKRWMDWIGGIAAQNKLVNRGNRLELDGRVLKSDSLITDGPYAETKESVGGYTLVKADTIEEACEMAKGCPIFSIGGTVEVREISVM